MIHPRTELRFVSPEIGLGVFATEPIPAGTLVYVKDQLEIEITPERFAAMDSHHRLLVERYSYTDESGIRILSWDLAKYVNHRCDCNTMSTGYGFEIALRDIAPGEEITDEYGLLNVTEEVPLSCRCRHCRLVLRPDDLETFGLIWDRQVQAALRCVNRVPQPLWPLLDSRTVTRLQHYLASGEGYVPVASLRWPGVWADHGAARAWAEGT